MAAVIAFRNEVIPDAPMLGDESNFLRQFGFFGGVAGFKYRNNFAGRTDFNVHVELLEKEGMPRVFGRKAQVKCVAPVRPDHRRIFAIPEVFDMQRFTSGLRSKELTSDGRNQSEANHKQKISKPFSEE
jgi:hypothetical protein